MIKTNCRHTDPADSRKIEVKHIQAAAAGFVVNTLAVIGTGGDAKLLEVNMEEFNLWRPSGPVDKVRRDLRRWRVRHQIK